MSEFRDVIAEVLQQVDDTLSEPYDGSGFVCAAGADAVLATPEMQWVKRYLRDHCLFAFDQPTVELLAACGWNTTVAAWVMEDQP